MTELLRATNITVGFPVARSTVEAARRAPRREVRAVDGVSLTVSRGQIVALVGESGCGKTTLAQALLKLQPTRSGSVVFEGQDLGNLAGRNLRDFRRRAQLIYQDPYESLDSRFRVREILEEPLEIHHIGPKHRRREMAASALERVGLTPAGHFLARYPHELSGGQRQRVAIASALILDPALLVADEPVSMLDVSVRAGVLRLLNTLKSEGLGILMITHDLSTVGHFADVVAVMYLGRVVEEGPAAQVLNNPQHPYTAALIEVAPRRKRVQTAQRPLTGETPDPTRLPAGCRFHPRCPIAIDDCRKNDPMLALVDTDQSTACIVRQGADRERPVV